MVEANVYEMYKLFFACLYTSDMFMKTFYATEVTHRPLYQELWDSYIFAVLGVSCASNT